MVKKIINSNQSQKKKPYKKRQKIYKSLLKVQMDEYKVQITFQSQNLLKK